jgi:hypothetical protein
MSLSLDLAAALRPLVGQTFLPPRTVSVSDGSGVSLAIDLLTVEMLGVSCEEIRLDVPALAGADIDKLKQWAGGLCGRITYLLEHLGPLEFDAQTNQVLIRSSPPDAATSPGQTKYYEVLLSSLGGGRFSLRRYQADSQTPGRTPVPIRVTHEQLAKLVNDLVGTLPTP